MVSEERDGSFRSKPVKRGVAGGNSELEIILFGSSQGYISTVRGIHMYSPSV
jgi:hypothetical protein